MDTGITVSSPMTCRSGPHPKHLRQLETQINPHHPIQDQIMGKMVVGDPPQGVPLKVLPGIARVAVITVELPVNTKEKRISLLPLSLKSTMAALMRLILPPCGDHLTLTCSVTLTVICLTLMSRRPSQTPVHHSLDK